VRGQVRGMRDKVRCRGEKLLLPLPLHVQGKKKHNAVQNGTVSCSLPFFFGIFSFFMRGPKMSYNNYSGILVYTIKTRGSSLIA